MDPGGERWEMQPMARLIGNLLRGGLVLSLLLVLSGTVLYLGNQGGRPAPDYRRFSGHTENFAVRAGRALEDVRRGRARGLILLGMFVMLLTPVARVLLSLVEFGLHRDPLYVAVTFIVLVILFFSLVGRAP